MFLAILTFTIKINNYKTIILINKFIKQNEYNKDDLSCPSLNRRRSKNDYINILSFS